MQLLLLLTMQHAVPSPDSKLACHMEVRVLKSHKPFIVCTNAACAHLASEWLPHLLFVHALTP
jgi:hypothetical protein